MAAKLPAFVVDRDGLAKLLDRKGKAFVVTELVQNAWDENATQVDVLLEPMGNGRYRLVVEDDNPEGFHDLRHAYTLFAESTKKVDATQRGRFNFGEKLVVAACETAKICTTKGTVMFVGDERRMSKAARASGSIFEGILDLTDEEAADVRHIVHTLLPPANIITTFNLTVIPPREPVRRFSAKLRTEIADSNGLLKPTTRKTIVEIYEPLPGETAAVYEMGIPVVETGDRFHVNVLQKVPLSLERDNVPPAYLRTLRVHVLNASFGLLTPADAKQSWITNAMEDPEAGAAAIRSVFAGKFGTKTVIYDPSDTEANKIAAEQGYIVVPGGALPKAAWAQVRKAGVSLPAGRVTPSPNPHDGDDRLRLLKREHWPEYISHVAGFAAEFAERLLGANIDVRIANDPKFPFEATYGPRKAGKSGLLTLNVGRLGHRWFEQINSETIDLLIHEFGHHECSDHLDHRYLSALSRLGATATMLAIVEPDFFARFGLSALPL